MTFFHPPDGVQFRCISNRALELICFYGIEHFGQHWPPHWLRPPGKTLNRSVILFIACCTSVCAAIAQKMLISGQKDGIASMMPSMLAVAGLQEPHPPFGLLVTPVPLRRGVFAFVWYVNVDAYGHFTSIELNQRAISHRT